ncbi:MAG: AAA family ATPase, partial [Acidobacteria bacterium]|nr:AAA family ATPase [Acidobacteriota bacterium]
FADARPREARLLGSFADLAGEAAGFTRAELEDGFPAGASPLASVLGSRLEKIPERVPVPLAEETGDGLAAPLPAGLARAAPGAVDLAARPLSPSALVLYSRNPAQYFLERVLRLRREETLTDTGSRTARGSRLHRLMEEAVPAFAAAHGPLTADNLDDALAFFRDHWSAHADPGPTPEVRAAEELWLFGGDSHPGALEWFLREEAGRGPSRPIRIEEKLEGTLEPADSRPALRVRGFVDRVDEGSDGGLRVMEYKSGSSAGRDEAFLQARLYARLAGGAAPAGIAVPFFRDRVWGEPERLDELDETIRAGRDGLADGEFSVPDEIKSFDWPLAIRPDLRHAAPARPPPVPAPPPGAPSPKRPAACFRPTDHDQRIAASDPKRHVVLVASAGTGKTTVLTERYLKLVRTGVPPRHILALTFTRKAAAEMKERIVKRLAGADVEGNPDLAEVAVSTLDAFNLGLIREFPLDAGVAPGVEVLDEREMPVLQQEAVERVLSGATGFDRRALAELPLLGKSLSRLDGIAKTFLDNRLTWRDTFEEEARRRARRPPADRPVLRERFGPVSDEVGRFLRGYGGTVPLPVRLALRLAPRPRSGDALDREFLTGWLRPDLKTAPRGAAGLVKPVGTEYQRLKQVLRGFNLDWLDALNERTFGPVWELLQAVESEYDALKEDRGVMDFDDLTSRATRLLRNTGEFAESRFRLEARYHHLLLDEFQDTSDPQWRLLRAIAEPWTHGEGLAAEEVRRVTSGRLRQPTIFVVGDHKQSIYRFRNARVEILGGTEAWIGRAFRTRPRNVLSWNFRSSAPLRSFVNDVAGAVAEADAATEGDWRFRYDPEQDRFPEEPGPGETGSGEEQAAIPISVAVSVVEHDDEAARRVAARIAALAAGGVPLDNIAILARVSTRLSAYREAVERLGLPTYLVRGGGFFETSEVRDLTALARFLARPASDLRAVELLRSRFFALPAAALAALRTADPAADTPFSDLLRTGGAIRGELSAVDAAALRQAGERAAAWIALSRRLPPSLAVRQILADTDYLARARAVDNGGFAGRQQAANVERALQHVQRVERSGFATFAAVARHLESAAANGHDATQAPLRAAGAVQVLTIHAAKGLEYEQVFLVDLNARTRGPGGGLRVQEGDDGRWSIALVADSSDWEIRDGGRSSAEERRCLYVGMTRARRGLTLSGTTKFTAKGAPGKAQGLAGYLPADLWLAAANTAREPRPEIAWKRHRLTVLPPSESG